MERTLAVVEGVSDQVAVEALARRHGVDLADAGVRVVVLGGAHRIARFLDELGPERDGRRLAGLCDAAEAPIFRKAGIPFYVCDADLEDELIRALGVPRVEEVVRVNGDLPRFRKLQQMPQWRGRATHEQLHRFIGVGARRKARYAQLLVDALDLGRVPPPLDAMLQDIAQ
jgi:hypothetical protein